MTQHVREKSSQSRRIHSATLRDDRGPRETRFVGYGGKNRQVCLMSRRRS